MFKKQMEACWSISREAENLFYFKQELLQLGVAAGTSDNLGQFYVVRGKEKQTENRADRSRTAAAAAAASRSQGEQGRVGLIFATQAWGCGEMPDLIFTTLTYRTVQTHTAYATLCDRRGCSTVMGCLTHQTNTSIMEQLWISVADTTRNRILL